MLAFYVTFAAFAASPQDWDQLDAQRWGERPAPEAQVQAQMLEEATRLAEEDDPLRALAQLQEARCRQDEACLPGAHQVTAPALASELAQLEPQPEASLGLRSVWIQWPLDEASTRSLDEHYAALGAGLEPGVDVLLLDRLARELPPEHPLSQDLVEHLEPGAEAGEGTLALLQAAQARYQDEGHELALPYPTTLGLSFSASDCADLLPEDTLGDLQARLHLEVTRCGTRTETWEESEDYTWMETEVYTELEEVVVRYEEECTEGLYYDDNNIQKEGWTQTTCEDVPVTELQEVEKTRQVERTGRRLVQHRRYVFELEGSSLGTLETEHGTIELSSQSFLVEQSLEDHSYDAEGGSRSWDPALSEQAARSGAAPMLAAAQLVDPLREAYAERLLAAAMDLPAPEADELIVQAWWWNRTIQPTSGPLFTAMTVVELPAQLEEASYALPELPEAPLIVDGYGQLHDTRDRSGWQVKSPGLLRPTNSGVSVLLDMRQSYLGPGWAQTTQVALRGGGGVDYASSSTFVTALYGGVSTQLDGLPDSGGELLPLGWTVGFSSGGGWANVDKQSGGMLAFHLAYEVQKGHEGEKGYKALSMVFPDLTLCLPGTKWLLGANLRVAWNWLGIQDPKKREAGEEIAFHHFTPISLGPAIGVGPVQLRAHATYLAFRPEPLRFGSTLELAF